MIYLDHGATTLHKPDSVRRAINWAIENCGNPGRGGHPAAVRAGEVVFRCREQAGKLFSLPPERVVFTSNCTHGLNIAINTLVKPGCRVVISGFEHNAVTRLLYALKAQITIAGRKLFDPEDTLEEFEAALRRGQDAAVFTHVSNVFGYILPVEKMATLCRQYQVPFIIDAAQSAGSMEINMEALGADFIAMPGHKGLLGPQGTGLLLCGREPAPLLFGGTGSRKCRTFCRIVWRRERSMCRESAAFARVWSTSQKLACRKLRAGKCKRRTPPPGGCKSWDLRFLPEKTNPAFCPFCILPGIARSLPERLPSGALQCGRGCTARPRRTKARAPWKPVRCGQVLVMMLPLGRQTRWRRRQVGFFRIRRNDFLQIVTCYCRKNPL